MIKIKMIILMVGIIDMKIMDGDLYKIEIIIQISDKILTPYDSVEIRTSNKPQQFHFSK